METVLIFAYMGWAIYSGYKVVSGRLEWLDRRAPLNMVVKFVLSVVVGYVVAAFYFIFLILQFLGIMSRIKKNLEMGVEYRYQHSYFY